MQDRVVDLADLDRGIFDKLLKRGGVAGGGFREGTRVLDRSGTLDEGFLGAVEAVPKFLVDGERKRRPRLMKAWIVVEPISKLRAGVDPL